MIVVHIETRKVEQMLNGLIRNLPKATGRGLNRFSAGMAVKLRKEARLRGHKTTGYLSSPKGIYSKKLAENVYGIKGPYYLQFLEEGTRPHWIPRTRKTELWAKQHGMSFQTFKYIVHKQGTKPHPFIDSVVKRETKRLINETVEKEINRTIMNKGKT